MYACSMNACTYVQGVQYNVNIAVSSDSNEIHHRVRAALFRLQDGRTSLIMNVKTKIILRKINLFWLKEPRESKIIIDQTYTSVLL